MSEKICDGPLGDVGTRLMFEDERIKIWEMALEPGEETAPHRHEHDYYLVILEGDRLAGVPHTTSTGPSAEYIDAPIEPDLIVRVPKGGTELARNIGKKFCRELIIELKD